MSEPERTLFASLDAKRFFWIPDSEVLPAGSFVLRSLTGKRITADEEAAAKFELPEERAKELAQEEMAKVAKKAGTLLAGAANLLRDAATKPKSPAVPPPLATLAGSLGLTEEQLRNDPKALLASLGTLAQGFASTLKEATSDNPADRESAKQRMDILAGIVREQTGADTTPMEMVPEKLREYLANPELEKKVREATEKLQQATRDLEIANQADAAGKKPTS